jgi:glutamate/tyrosine decarboxylase-like PLP-dependent enzyme
MHPRLRADEQDLAALLSEGSADAAAFLAEIQERPVMPPPGQRDPAVLPQGGLGARGALAELRRRYRDAFSASAGPRYFGFVTGGSTPAALVADWLTSAFDQNALGVDNLAVAELERDAVSLLRQLFGLPDSLSGVFVTGTTMASFVGLAQARQWLGREHGVDVAEEGAAAMPPARVLSGAPHASAIKALAMVGLGRRSLTRIPLLPDREAVDVEALARALAGASGPAIVVANAGTVDTVDFDDLRAIAGLRDRFRFWLHVDAAFGAFAACSPAHRHLVDGLDLADSIAVDLHKWLNVPYDSGVALTRHPELQFEVFRSSAAYLGTPTQAAPFHLTPESSRRLRALPTWTTLLAYGADGYREIVERCADLAGALGELIAGSQFLRLLAPVRLNVVCFTLAGEVTASRIDRLLAAVHAEGAAFFTSTNLGGVPGVRAAFSSWRTTQSDMEIAWQSLERAARALSDPM